MASVKVPCRLIPRCAPRSEPEQRDTANELHSQSVQDRCLSRRHRHPAASRPISQTPCVSLPRYSHTVYVAAAIAGRTSRAHCWASTPLPPASRSACCPARGRTAALCRARRWSGRSRTCCGTCPRGRAVRTSSLRGCARRVLHGSTPRKSKKARRPGGLSLCSLSGGRSFRLERRGETA
jgi:hypothetical protein